MDDFMIGFVVMSKFETNNFYYKFQENARKTMLFIKLVFVLHK
jgi:hypothetical protein